MADNHEQRPLLADAASTYTYAPLTDDDDDEAAITAKDRPSRSVDDDVLPETSALGRTLSWTSSYMLVMSRVIGSGIFATPGTILQAAGSPGLSLLLWAVGALVAAAGLAVALEYGCMLPRSGGQKVYLEFTYRHPRFLASTLVAPLRALQALAAGLLSAVTAVHAVAPRVGVRLQDALGWAKMGIVGFMVLCGGYAVALRPAYTGPDSGPGPGGAADALLSWETLWHGSNWSWGVACTALFKVFYSYAGLDNVSNVLNEVRDPVRTLRSVTLTALVTSCALYMLVNVAYFLVVPLDDIRGSGELVAALFFERIFGQDVGRKVLPLAVALSAVGNVLVVAFAMARLKQEIARQGFLPFSDVLSSTKPFNSPLGGLLVNYIPSLLVIVLPPSSEVYSFILEVEGYTGQIFGLATGLGLLWLRYKRPHLKRPFKAWMSAVVLRLLLGVGLLAAPFFPPADKYKGGLFYATYAIVGASTIVGSIAYWYVWTVAVPRWRGYRLEEETTILADGTSVTKLVHKRK
ncbi:Amino acid/polyamine transporter I [Metarhizium guizhouense ARSEF 977]|uniref:Amino acid/polyamine transporter I n=1 Tax=Metarhizium guizhouense (strain ARSEF 977) TaxID=1276136 RepID=A0A0B4HBE1_METGA|nr:Amino acid/polyamine transporter I [Metarhizium guizhouense ARSEF 977]